MKRSMRNPCTCGVATDHLVATRRTADGKSVQLWSDGQVTWGLGYGMRGVGRARYYSVRQRNLQAGWIVIGDVELYDAAEVPALVRAARKGMLQPGATIASARDFMRRALKSASSIDR